MPSLFRRPETPTTHIPKPTVPPVPEVEEAEDIAKLSKKRRGKQFTDVAGPLEPINIGKRYLLS